MLDGAPAAVIACVRYAHAFGFVGLYIVREDLRGHGHGIALWDAGHERLGQLPSGLEAVEAQIPNYARSGYVAGGWTQRWQGRAPTADLDGPYWIDIPRQHAHATRLATDRRMQPVFRTSRMVRGSAPPRDAALVYGVTSLELG
jgi:hypothetical protein